MSKKNKQDEFDIRVLAEHKIREASSLHEEKIARLQIVVKDLAQFLKDQVEESTDSWRMPDSSIMNWYDKLLSHFSDTLHKGDY